MSYNTRRGGHYGTPSSAVGQRRPHFQNNQSQGYKPNMAQGGMRPQTPNDQHVKPHTNFQQNQKPNVGTPAQAPKVANTQPPKQDNVQTPQKNEPPTPVQKPVPAPQQTPQQTAQQEPKIIFKKDSTAPEKMDAESSDSQNKEIGDENGDADSQAKGKRVLFFRTGKGRISKKERLRKRNQRLRKMLQPKNAPMVLNELVGSVTYNIIEAPAGFASDEASFRATVLVDGVEHCGYGKSKALAKSNAAEAAMKHMVLKKITSSITNNPQNTNAPNAGGELADEDEKMEVVTDEDDSFSWSHVASFALHKLFNSWDETNNKTNGVSPSPGNLARLVANPHAALEQKPEHKPAKKMPDNANEMNPIMLLNQMRPLTSYEEVAKVGVPPNVRFTFTCNIDGQSFTGSGTSKKSAKKHAAFLACQAVLGVVYTKEVLDTIGTES